MYPMQTRPAFIILSHFSEIRHKYTILVYTIFLFLSMKLGLNPHILLQSHTENHKIYTKVIYKASEI